MEQKKWNRNDRRPPIRRAQEPAEAAENMLEGRNAVQEALAAGRPIDKLYIAAGETDRALARLAAMARQAGAAIVETDRRGRFNLRPAKKFTPCQHCFAALHRS